MALRVLKTTRVPDQSVLQYTLDKNASSIWAQYVTFGSDSANADADIESGYTLYADFLWKF
jgi:hypothetical protein